MGKIYEIWIWQRRMGHVNFKNLVKVMKKYVVRNMPEITKPSDRGCKHYHLGNKTRVEFKKNEHSTTRPFAHSYQYLWANENKRFK
jgi:hypothetical protein